MGVLLLPLYARRDRFWELIDSLAGPTIVIAFVLLVIPLSKSAGQFYFGVKTLSETTGSLVGESFRQPPLGTVADGRSRCADGMDVLWKRKSFRFCLSQLVDVRGWLLFR